MLAPLQNLAVTWLDPARVFLSKEKPGNKVVKFGLFVPVEAQLAEMNYTVSYLSYFLSPILIISSVVRLIHFTESQQSQTFLF